MILVSLCMIVKNEERVLERCLNSVKDFVDEIIIVDTGSTDSTKEIAKKFTDKVYDFEWCYDFAKARNYSFSKATKDYIMWLDADDVILEKDLKKLLKLKQNLSKNVDAVMLKYDLNVDENGTPMLSFYRERIVRRNANFRWTGKIHEVIETRGNIVKEDISVTHKKLHVNEPERNLIIFQKMIKENEELDARQTFYYARELYYNKLYHEAIFQFEKFLDMKDAWVENKISACVDLYNLYNQLGNEELAINSILNTFKYDVPRAEACCLLGNFFMNKENYTVAMYWYNEALKKKFDVTSGGFFVKDYYDYIPLINLSVCYYKTGNLAAAKKYNELAGKAKPSSPQYLQNKKFYETIGA